MNEPGHFQLKNVSIGARSKNNYLQVLGGLVPGEEVVISGQFMLDSESRLREAALKFLKPSQVSGPNPAEEVVKKTSKKELSIAESKIFYACPMPEHVDTLFEQPGKCPLCGMKLVPIPNQVTADQTTNSSKLEGHVHE